MIWYLEPDAPTREMIVYALISMGFEARGFDSSDAFWDALNTRVEKPEIAVLRMDAPDRKGKELLGRIRRSEIFRTLPVIAGSANDTEYNRVRSLDEGADYFLSMPCGTMELVSCIRAVLRRCGKQKRNGIISLGRLVVNPEEYVATVDGKPVELTHKEFELLKLLVSNPGTAFTRDHICSQVWGTDYCGETRTVDVHIRMLRQKLGECGGGIETIRNVGYRWQKAG